MGTQLTSLSVVLNSTAREGSASWTMLASSWAMNAPMEAMPTMSQGYQDCRAMKDSGGGSISRSAVPLVSISAPRMRCLKRRRSLCLSGGWHANDALISHDGWEEAEATSSPDLTWK